MDSWENLVDGINEVELERGLKSRFGYCSKCDLVYPPDEAHDCALPKPELSAEGDRLAGPGRPLFGAWGPEG